ncbi:molecular chaperone HtpG, partial [Acinetobacter sp. RIT592]
KDEGFYDKIKDILLFKDINSNYITLNDYLEKCKEKHENKVFYVSDEEQQSQYIKLFKDYDLDAVILDSSIDNHFISFIEFKNQGVTFNRIDADLSDVLKDKNEKENKENKTEIENLFKEYVKDKVKDYSVESLKSEDTTAIILVSEQSRRMAEMKSQFAGMDLGMNFEEEKTLVINDNSPIIKKLVSLKDDESKKDQIELICNQIVDIALLANKELDAKELDEFISRNNKLMNMLIGL